MGWALFMLLLAIPFYVIPTITSYLYVHHQYKTKWKSLTPELDDIIMVFTPLLNWGLTIFWVIDIMFEGIEKSSKELSDSDLNKKLMDKGITKRFFRL